MEPVPHDLWVFGYGSLLWRPGFEFAERATGYVEGYLRRFWQGSQDHRGTPEQPGRVVTLEWAPEALCRGVAFRVPAVDRATVMAQLDERESGGFERLQLPFHFAREPGRVVDALVYVAPPGNPNFLGPAPLDRMVVQMREAVGMSGSNREYALRLAESLRAEGIEDEHVDALALRLAR